MADGVTLERRSLRRSAQRAAGVVSHHRRNDPAYD
jgi:hypothetical protein